MIEVYIKETGDREKPEKGFGYVVGTDVRGYSRLFYESRARFLDGHFILEETHVRGVAPEYHQFKIMSTPKGIDKILYPKAKEHADKFLKKLIPELVDSTSIGKPAEKKPKSKKEDK